MARMDCGPEKDKEVIIFSAEKKIYIINGKPSDTFSILERRKRSVCGTRDCARKCLIHHHIHLVMDNEIIDRLCRLYPGHGTLPHPLR